MALSNTLRLWAASLPGAVALWLILAAAAKAALGLSFGWNSPYRLVVVSWGVAVCAVFSAVYNYHWIKGLKSPALVLAMLTHEYTHAYAAVDVQTGELDTLILPHVNTHCMQLFLDEVAQRQRNEHIVMVFDGAGWHVGGELAPPANMRLLRLPP